VEAADFGDGGFGLEVVAGGEVEGEDHAGAAEATFAVDEGGQSLVEELVDAGKSALSLLRGASREVFDWHSSDVKAEAVSVAGVVRSEGFEGH